ncbi:MAG: adenylate/guanylate cyclase domain-containing protein, partial [Rudaea sp.]
MSSDFPSDLKAEIGHVLFVDIVGYSKLLINEQSELLEHLNAMVRGSEQVRAADAQGKLIRLATGDGMALVFRNDPEAPVKCALELSRADKEHPELQLRMGIHSGPINEVIDVNEHANVTGAGINLAQRVMDCGDAGHILLSKRVADDLAQYRHWQPYLHQLGECVVKHGVRLEVVNLYTDELGNPELPAKFKPTEPAAFPVAKASARKYLLPAGAIAIALMGLLIFSLSHKSGLSTSTGDQGPVASTIKPHAIRSIAVLPLDNYSGDPAQDYFAEGMTDELTTDLAIISQLRVISRGSTMQFKGAQRPPTPDIAKALNVDAVVEGSVLRVGDKVRITAQLIDARADKHLWAKSFERNSRDVLALQDELASAIAREINVQLTPAELSRLTRAPVVDPAAHDAYLKGW